MTLNVSEQAQPQARPPVSETKKEIAAAWAVCEAARKEVRDALYDCEDAAMDAYEAREAAEEGARDAAFASYDADKKQEAFGAAMAVVRAAWASYEAAEEEAFDEVRSESGAAITESHAAYIAAREKASAAFAA
ncbi:MAG TPA: hypothetical protein ACQGQN_08955, partial [Xylella fastidiosa subsp. fastidiosa]